MQQSGNVNLFNANFWGFLETPKVEIQSIYKKIFVSSKYK